MSGPFHTVEQEKGYEWERERWRWRRGEAVISIVVVCDEEV
jgi:hypothetical protein